MFTVRRTETEVFSFSFESPNMKLYFMNIIQYRSRNLNLKVQAVLHRFCTHI